MKIKINMKNENILIGIFLGNTKTNKNNFFLDFLQKNSKIKTIFCNKLDYPKNIKIGQEWKINYYKNFKNINNWLFGNIIEENKNNSNWFICLNFWIRQVLKINKINCIYKIYLKSKNIKKKEETSKIINILLIFLKKIGYSFNLEKCNICKNKIEIGFINLDEGGILCFFCKRKEKNTFHIPTLTENIKKTNKNINISKFQEKELEIFLNNLINFINNRCGFYKKINLI